MRFMNLDCISIQIWAGQLIIIPTISSLTTVNVNSFPGHFLKAFPASWAARGRVSFFLKALWILLMVQKSGQPVQVGTSSVSLIFFSYLYINIFFWPSQVVSRISKAAKVPLCCIVHVHWNSLRSHEVSFWILWAKGWIRLLNFWTCGISDIVMLV